MEGGAQDVMWTCGVARGVGSGVTISRADILPPFWGAGRRGALYARAKS